MYNTVKLLKETIIFNDCIRYKEVKEAIKSDDIENTILRLKGFICEVLPTSTNTVINNIALMRLIQFVYIFRVLEDNLSTYKYINSNHSLFDYCNNIIKQEDFNLYFEKYYMMDGADKPEDIDLISTKTKDLLNSLGLLPDQIRNDILMNINLGFTLNDIQILETHINEYLDPLIIYTGKIHEIASALKIEKEIDLITLGNILLFFSFKDGDKYNYLEMELRSVYYKDDIIYLTSEQTLHILTLFKNLILSEHFIEYYGLESNKSLFQLAQNKITKFFSYKIADILYQNSFQIPHDNLNNFIVDLIIRHANLESEINDIDVLALDNINKILFNIELKYFKPAIRFSDFFTDSFPNKYIEKTMCREKKVFSIKEYVLNDYFNIYSNIDEYKLVSILITSRPKYKGVYGEHNIKIVTYFDLIKRIYDKSNNHICEI